MSRESGIESVQIVGRSGSVFTRVASMFAEELSVPYELIHITDMRSVEPEVYAGNPALKMPVLRSNDSTLFGTQNICRALAERSNRSAVVIWPEDLSDALSRNANELVWHCMTAQVQIAFGTIVAKLPCDNIYFAKATAGLEGALAWLDANLEDVLDLLPENRDVSLFEIALFCLMEHLAFRATIETGRLTGLRAFAERFRYRPSAQATAYR